MERAELQTLATLVEDFLGFACAAAGNPQSSDSQQLVEIADAASSFDLDMRCRMLPHQL